MPRKGKCFSTCRKRPKPECEPPECYYTNGNKYKYCRLAFTRKMNKDCVSELKKPLDRQVESINVQPVPNRSLSLSPKYEEYGTPRSFTRSHSPVMDLRPSKKDIAVFRDKYVKRRATRKIGHFFRKTDPRVRSKFLQSVCSDAGVCIAFGTNASAIRKHFDDFNNFNLLSKPAERIGSVSSNGFVKELTYVNRGYVANAVLKSSADFNADNLLYEALVGFFLNKMSRMYPTFIETYGLYQYNIDGLAYNACKKDKLTDPMVLSVGLTRIAQSTKDITNQKVKGSCLSPISMAVLIQHLKSAKTMREMCETQTFVTKDLLYVLYQIYMTLSSMSDVFTHYDLHQDNVLVYEPVAGSHIEYHYHLEDGTETMFRSKYIAKIIDYGRCYYNDIDSVSIASESKSFYDNLVCKECKPRCGSGRGYEWLDYKPRRIKRDSYICSQKSNVSHDLRFLYSIGNKVKGMDLGLRTLIGRVVYGQGVAKGKGMYGTEPRPYSGLPLKINNIHDAFAALKDLVGQSREEIGNMVNYKLSKKLGELHIYGDKRTPMRYVPAK